MGEWAHPDDDTSIIGPCGVWHDRYDVKCGVIMVTRGEGGGNAVGQEIGPALGLRRENEDRVAHFRSGTVDIFNLDRVDFFYNTSAPLTQFFWGQDETLRRITRIIRTTQPEIYIGFTPTLNAGHGNHQQAGRYIWEGVLAAADPSMFPEQLEGPNALSTWQVKKVFSGGSTAGTGGTQTAADCTTGFTPAATNLDTVAGAWLGYDSPYAWPAGNVQGRPAGTAKSWAQVAAEGRSAYPTQSRTMFQGAADPSCSRFGMTQSFVPFQPNDDPAAGRDDAILFGATKADPGGLPEGTLEYITFSRFYNTPGNAFQATVHVRSGSGELPAGSVALNVPSGWTADPAKPIGPISDAAESTVTFDVTPAAGAAVNSNFKLSALLSTGGATGYTDNVMRIVSPVEGRFQRWGKWEEYDGWLNDTAPQANRLGRSAAAQSIGVGETITVPVDVHNWSGATQSGAVSLTLPANFTADAISKPYGALAPGEDATVEFELTNTDTSLPANQTPNITIATSYSAPAGSGSEALGMSIVPTTAIPQAGAAPQVDGAEGAGEYGGPALDVGRRWEGGVCSPVGVDCGTSGTPGDPATSTYAKVAWHGDDLYFFVHVRDDYQSYAVKPAECVAHWLADSVEILIDPRGNATQTNRDTASTFKLGVFPYHERPREHQRQRRQRAVLGARRRQPPGLLHGAAGGHRRRRAERARGAGRLERDVGRRQPDHDRPLLRRRGLRPRGQDPAGRPAGGAEPGPRRPEHHPLRQRQHRRGGHDHAAPHRPELAPGVVDVRQRPVRPVALGPCVRRRLHAARRPADDRGGPERLEPQPQRGRVAADDRPVGARRRADLRAPAGPRERPHRGREGRADRLGRRARADRHGVGHRAHLPVVGREGLHPGLGDELLAARGPGAGLRHDRVRDDGRHGAAVVAGHERTRGALGHRAAIGRQEARLDPARRRGASAARSGRIGPGLVRDAERRSAGARHPARGRSITIA